ncbi:hypothetical protein [Streptomyces sp. NPDC004266]|uniref:hypothetical protein n=1 Tax=Streptomyces sp. NPDC004266 TaxID=3364693 RepID=UPI003681C755
MAGRRSRGGRPLDEKDLAALRSRTDMVAGYGLPPEAAEHTDAILLAFLSEPRTVGEISDRRLVYRSHVHDPHVLAVERRTAVRHLSRLVGASRVSEVEPGRFRAT